MNNPSMQHPTITPDQILVMYTSSLDSVTLIHSMCSNTTITKQDLETIARNVEHLRIMKQKTWWTTEDLTPFDRAVAAGEAAKEQ